MKTLGERLRKAREKKGFTQVYVKTRTGLNNKTISGYENNVSEPDSQSLRILADLYEVSVDWLYGRETAPEYHMSEEDIRILEKFRKLNEEDQEHILRFIERLEEK